MRAIWSLLLLELLFRSAAHAAEPDVGRVLRDAARAMGPIGGTGNLEAVGKIDAERRTGYHEELVRPRDGAFATRDRFSLFTESQGYDGRTRWKQDRSGATHLLNAPYTARSTVMQAWVKRRAYLRPGSGRVAGIARQTIADRPATVLTMRPPGGNPVRLAFDDATHLLIQARWDSAIGTISEAYSDYRAVAGFKAPFRIEIEESGDRSVVTVDHYARPQSSWAAFSRPRAPSDTDISGPATLPLAALSYAVVPARVNGHELNFVLDTGGHDILLPDVATRLGLTTEGQGTSGGSGPGRVTTSDTQVAKLELGTATMTNQHFAVLDLGTGFQAKGQPPRAGILGLEVFERMAVTIDEPHNRLTIEPFRAGRRCEGDKIPLVFDDDQPAVAGTIDGIPAQIGIDVGNGGVPIVLWRWAEGHNLVDRFRNGKESSGSGVGGSNVTYRTPHHDVVIGHTEIRNTDVNYATTPTGYFSSRADSMNLGRTLLQQNAVRFDYAQGHICILPK